MIAQELSEMEVNELERALLSHTQVQFEELIHEKYSLDFSYLVARLLWDMYHMH